MLRFDHLGLPVRDWAASRDWYVKILGLSIEFEMPEQCFVAVKDEFDFAIFLSQVSLPSEPGAFTLTFQVEDVHKAFEEISGKGMKFDYAPQKRPWGYGAELTDPNGYRICLWDQTSMTEKS